ncbi:MAG TPA: hypothetical protein VKF17_07795 [Isosphaeraceae bacterium]|nr:hypothetical protein [Isosphaeraceae bacterium]
MEELEGQNPGGAGLVFAAHNNHTPHCGLPPRVRNIDNPRLYYGYFENRFGEQFVFVFDPTTKTGTISGGDLDWGEPKTFTLWLGAEALSATRTLADQIVRQGSAETSRLPIIDAALALGRLTGLTGKDEIIWLRACLKACVTSPELPE